MCSRISQEITGIFVNVNLAGRMKESLKVLNQTRVERWLFLFPSVCSLCLCLRCEISERIKFSPFVAAATKDEVDDDDDDGSHSVANRIFSPLEPSAILAANDRAEKNPIRMMMPRRKRGTSDGQKLKKLQQTLHSANKNSLFFSAKDFSP